MSATGKRFVPLGAFLGDHEGVGSLSLPAALGTGTRNVTVNKVGNLTTILGYTAQFSPGFTGVSGLFGITSLHRYVQQRGDGTVVRQLLAIFDDHVASWVVALSVDDGVNWALILDHGVASVGSLAVWTQIGNVLILTNGVIAPMKWDGSTYALVGDVQAGPPFVVDATAGELDGSYQYRIRAVRANGAKLTASVASDVVQATKRALQVTWFPDPDVTVTGYEVYRTTGTGKVFFFEQFVAGRTVPNLAISSLTDTALVRNVALDQHGDAPYIATRAAGVHKGRVWYVGRAAQPRTVWIADAGFPESVYKDVNAIDFTDNNWEDQALGVTGDYKRMAIVWEEWSVWTVSGTGQVSGLVVDFNRTRSNAEVGTVSMSCVVEAPQGARYFAPDGSMQQTGEATLAYLSPLRDLRVFDGSDATIISSSKQDFLARMAYSQRRLAHAVHDRQRGEITWMFAADDALVPNAALTWHYRSGAMVERDWPFLSVVAVETEGEGTFLLAGNNDGVVYRLWNGHTFAGAPIAWQVTTKALYGTGSRNDRSGLTTEVLLSYQKRWRFADILLAMTDAEPVTASWLEAEDDRVIGAHVLAVGTIPVTTSDGLPILTADGVPLVAPDWPNIPRVLFHDLRGRYTHRRGIRLRLSGSVSTGVATVMGANVAYQLLTGLKRQVA